MAGEGFSELDLAAARIKYEEERLRRLGRGPDMVELTGELAAYLDDPYTAAQERPAVHEESDVIIIGAGLGGLMIGAGLRKIGVERIRLIDSAGDVGGVWYWNRYPGVRCDTESLIYLPLLEETGEIPPDKYATGPFIYSHAQSMAKTFDLYEDALFQTTVQTMEWDEGARQWRLTTDRGDQLAAKFVVLAIGSLVQPKLPAIPGIERFRGKSFHTSRWDYQYTGGSAESDPTTLSDKVIGVIGNGATGVQCIPPLARSAKDVYVFQRTPSTVGVRNNRPVDRAYFQSLPPGWQAERRRNFTTIVSGGHAEVDLVKDGWTELFATLVAAGRHAATTTEEAEAERERVDLLKMEQVRARISAVVKDPEVADSLKPWYPYMCKRPTFHDEYLMAFNRPNVHLVDTRGAGIDRITEHGLVVGDREIELDCLVFATGFEANTAYTHRFGFDVVGRGGTVLSEKWKDGLKTLHGIMTAGFPNMFLQPAPNGQNTVTVNFPDMMEENAQQMVFIVDHLRRTGHDVFEVTEEAEDDWVRTIIEKTPPWLNSFLESCTPGRYNNEGNLSARPPGNRDYGDGTVAFFGVLAAWRAAGTLPGLRLERTSSK